MKDIFTACFMFIASESFAWLFNVGVLDTGTMHFKCNSKENTKQMKHKDANKTCLLKRLDFHFFPQ
jgi:hypothetical protein